MAQADHYNLHLETSYHRDQIPDLVPQIIYRVKMSGLGPGLGLGSSTDSNCFVIITNFVHWVALEQRLWYL